MMAVDDPDSGDFFHRILDLVEPRKRVAFEVLLDLPPTYVVGEIVDEHDDEDGNQRVIRPATVLDFTGALKADRIDPDQLIRYFHERGLIRPVAEDA